MRRELVPYRTPFALMRRLTDEMDRIFEDFEIRRPFAFFKPEVVAAEWAPIVELLEKEDRLVVRAELPGLKKEDVKIEVTAEYLTLQGERRQEKEEKEKGYIRTERFYGTFFRQIPLPEGANPEVARATFKDGVLEIEVPILVKKPEAGRRLPIEEPKEKEKEKELVAAR
ncbi:MAG TPA: Hsp20/alpha crystallin family protein [Vicinamibacterales bacterium]|nr:Hsp20/alpha crystallin family protein [Vicinamibacterales bacterium]